MPTPLGWIVATMLISTFWVIICLTVFTEDDNNEW